MLNALATAAGWRLGGVLGAATGAAAATYLLPSVDKVKAEWQQDQRANIAGMAYAAAEAAALSPEDLGERMGQSPRTRLLTATAAEAAAKTAWPPKVVALGRVLAAGLLATDDALIDTEPLSIAAFANIEAPHGSLLDSSLRRRPG